MWVRLEVMGHICVLARPHNTLRVLPVLLWLLDPISASERLHRSKMRKFLKLMILE
jgi:hypothetical protein